MLTRKQRELLLYVHERLQADGVSPSFDEMKDALDLKSKSGIHRLITALEERGFIRRLPNRARALEVLRLPEGHEAGAASEPTLQRRGFTPSVIEGGLNKSEERSGSGRSDGGLDAGREIPVMGRIAAGVPISAIEDHSGAIAVPGEMVGAGEHFALEVQGDSMIEAGIHDGDTVLVRRGDTATAGDIVVALIDEEEATLKTFRRKGEAIVLEAANPAYEPRELHPAQVRVQGKLVGLLRRYH